MILTNDLFKYTPLVSDWILPPFFFFFLSFFSHTPKKEKTHYNKASNLSEKRKKKTIHYTFLFFLIKRKERKLTREKEKFKSKESIMSISCTNFFQSTTSLYPTVKKKRIN